LEKLARQMADSRKDPKLRHEFVGMMFAVTIGEVGLQVASLVQAKHYIHFLPFYSRLLLATIVITSSWVGWSLSEAPGARRDVAGVFTWAFVTLLLDVFLVVTYFIIVRTIEVGKGTEPTRIDPPEKVAWLILIMFALYFIWDLITKICAYDKARDGNWFRHCGLRMIPTCICVILALYIRSQLESIDLAHYLNADLALLTLALLFRSLKDIVSEGFPKSGKVVEKAKVFRALAWSLVCVSGIWLGTISAKGSWGFLPPAVAHDIEAPVSQ
jgi:hypothetical protein